MAVTVTAEEEIPRLRLIPPAPDEPPEIPRPQQPFPTKEFLSSALGVLTGISLVLSVRLALMLAGIGAFVLAFVVVAHPSWGGLVGLTLYNASVFVPVVWLAKLKG